MKQWIKGTRLEFMERADWVAVISIIVVTITTVVATVWQGQW